MNWLDRLLHGLRPKRAKRATYMEPKHHHWWRHSDLEPFNARITQIDSGKNDPEGAVEGRS